MPETTITGPEQTDTRLVDTLWNRRAELLYGFAVAVLLFAFVDPVLLVGLVLTVATVAAAWLGFRELLLRADRDDAGPAPATHPRSSAASQRAPEKTPAHTPWRGHHAA